MRHIIAGLVLISLFAVLLRVGPPALQALRSKPTEAAGALPIANVAAVPKTPNARALRVLFVGNSHTFFHDMPRMLQQLTVAAQEPRRLEPGLVAAGGSTLAQHLERGDIREPLASGPWDYVVLQEQQQRPTWTFNRQQLDREFFAPARTFDVMIRAAGARTVLYAVPARKDGDPDNVRGDSYEAMQTRSNETHQQLARELGAILAPAGPAWQWLHRQHPELQLWEPDGIHPTLAGAYLTACVFYATLYDRSPLDNPYRAGLSTETAQLLQRAADVSRAL